MLSTFVEPLFYAPLSESFGRKNILHVPNVLFLNVGCGLPRTPTQMIVLRFLPGLPGTAPIAIGSAMALYSLAPLTGPGAAPSPDCRLDRPGWGPDRRRWTQVQAPP